jgi:hypothetical protein
MPNWTIWTGLETLAQPAFEGTPATVRAALPLSG